MTSNYRRFLKLLVKWPLDTTKSGRDIGQHIREEVTKAFPAGGVFEGNEEKCNRAYSSLKKLSENHYGELYKRTSDSSSTGLSAQACNELLSSEFLKSLKEEQRGLFARIFKRTS